jgi:AbrB family looped-hinge helix DNA binding protein
MANSPTKYQPTDKIIGEILGVRVVQNHGRIQLPKTVREKLLIKDGDKAYWIEDTDGRITLRKVSKL